MGRYFNDFVNDKNLSHHGILGMSWGKKNGPPYPLDGSDHSAAEKKAGWRKSLDGGSGESKSEKKSKKQKKIEAARTLREFEKNRSIEEDKSTKKWDSIYNEIEKSDFDYNSKKFHINRAIEADLGDRLEIQSKYRDKINKYLMDNGLSKKKLSDKEIDKLSKKIYKYADKQIDKNRPYNLKLEKQMNDHIDIGKKSNDYMLNTAKNDSKTISKQVSKELVNDLIRWNKDGSDNYMSGKDSEKVRKHIEDAVKKNVENASNPYDFKNGTYNFVIDGIDVYSDYAPLTVTYNPEKKKVVRIDYT